MFQCFNLYMNFLKSIALLGNSIRNKGQGSAELSGYNRVLNHKDSENAHLKASKQDKPMDDITLAESIFYIQSLAVPNN